MGRTDGGAGKEDQSVGGTGVNGAKTPFSTESRAELLGNVKVAAISTADNSTARLVGRRGAELSVLPGTEDTFTAFRDSKS